MKTPFEMGVGLSRNFCGVVCHNGISRRGLSGNGGEGGIEIGGAGKAALFRNFQFTQRSGSQQTDGQLHPLDGDILPGGNTVEFFEQGREIGGGQVGYISKFF